LTAPALEVRALRAGYGGRMIVDGVDLTVAAGEIVTLIGQNGAGKSTVLKAIANMIRLREGQVLLRGDPVFALPPQRLLRRGLAYIPQGRSLFPRLTVAENLRMGGYLLGDVALLRERIAAAEAMFPALAALRGQLAASLSGGEQRTLEIARTLVMDPAVIMLDEPSIGLAPRVVDTVFATLRRLAAHGKAVLMVEQTVRKALEISDRGYVLELGRVRFADSGQGLLADDRVGRLYMGVRG
jgi:branched-chain amino acid transport system ATP-binding protein